MARWISQRIEDNRIELQDFSKDPDPQCQAERLAASLNSLWDPAKRPSSEALEQLLAQFQAPAGPQGALTLTGHALFRRAKACRRRAGGADGWQGSHWAALPEQWFDRLAAVWNRVLAGAPLPASWASVRVAALPKEGGDYRPLALASLAWRLGSSCLLKQLRAWFAGWLPPQLLGGVPGRSADQGHAVLAAELSCKSTPAARWAGCKADVRKFFDTLSPEIAIRVFEHCNAPKEVVRLLRMFYMNQQRWVAVQGHFHRAALQTGSLLQGCPWSPVLANCCMALWVTQVTAAAPSVQVQVFLDDRTLLARSRDPVADLLRAHQAGSVVDSALGLSLHQGKSESFAGDQTVREELLEFADDLGVPQTEFKFLGVRYRTAGVQVFQEAQLTEELKERGRRIRLLCRGVRSRLWPSFGIWWGG